MAAPFLRNDLLTCAGVTAVLCVIAFVAWPHSDAAEQAQTVAVQAKAAAPIASATPTTATPLPQKPSAYGEAFVPPSPHAKRNAPVAPQPNGAVNFTGRGYANVAPAVMAANLISAPPPSYPLLARLAHVRGQVTVQAVISRNGLVAEVRALDGHHLLRGAALDEVRRRRYRPYRVDGQPTDVSTLIKVDFNPQG